MLLQELFEHKVVVKITGGLGNQLFQYAMGRALSIEKNIPLWLDISFFKNDESYNRIYLLDKLDIHYDRISEQPYFQTRYTDYFVKYYKRLEVLFCPNSRVFVEEPYSLENEETSLQNYFRGGPYNKFYNEIFDSYSKNVILNGYWQSEKYFKRYKDVIIHDFKIKAEIPDKVHAIADEIDNVNSVCIGVRQYTDSKASVNHFKLNADYYKKAIEIMSKKVENPHFYIFTLETKWAKVNIKSEHPITIIEPHSASEEAHVDLYLMAKCKHFIIANSTYHWWGAYLSDNKNKIVVAPEKGWGNEYPIPEEWIKIKGETNAC
ncbi:alpha-1,2-fucosyltransferase [Sulfurovum sp.]|uniref:alpha-1,2-fucosyltransferase n=1 Tax=Sulfurovum sp. TaxID=1969726 RepID=UPI0035689B50